MRDEVHFRERGAHIPRARITVHSTPGGRSANWYTRLEDKGYYWVNHGPNGEEGGFVFRSEGSVLTVGTSEGTKKYRSSSNRHRVESYVTGRTGLSSYSEDSRAISEDFDLGEYFEAQRKGAEGEATKWLAIFVVGTVATLTLAATGTIGAALRGLVRLAGYDAEAWYDSCLGFRSLRGGGWSFGRRIPGANWRVDFHQLPTAGRHGRRLPNFLRGRRWPHYHRRGPGSIGRHRPWEQGRGGFWGRF